MYFGDYWGDLVYIEIGVVDIGFVGFVFVDVMLYWWFLEMFVGCIDGEFVGVFWDVDFRVG